MFQRPTGSELSRGIGWCRQTLGPTGGCEQCASSPSPCATSYQTNMTDLSKGIERSHKESLIKSYGALLSAMSTHIHTPRREREIKGKVDKRL